MAVDRPQVLLSVGYRHQPQARAEMSGQRPAEEEPKNEAEPIIDGLRWEKYKGSDEAWEVSFGSEVCGS